MLSSNVRQFVFTYPSLKFFKFTLVSASLSGSKHISDYILGESVFHFHYLSQASYGHFSALTIYTRTSQVMESPNALTPCGIVLDS